MPSSERVAVLSRHLAAAGGGTGRISTHILDTARGKPAADVAVRLSRSDDGGAWIDVGPPGRTNGDGRAVLLDRGGPIRAGTYKLSFSTAPYFQVRRS